MRDTVIVTGGSGFIGLHIIDRLEKSGDFQIINLDVRAPKKEHHRPYWVHCDIMDLERLTGIIVEARPKYLLHLAARTDTDGHVIEEYSVNSTGTMNVITIASRVSSLERLIFVSTQFVVGPGRLPDGDQDFRPHTAYGASKVAAEKAIRNASLSCVWTIVRPTNVWGAWHPRYPNEFWRVLDRGLYLHPTSKRVVRSYGYVGNVASQICALLFESPELVDRKVFYVGDAPIELLDWVNAFSLRLTGRRARVVPKVVVHVLALLGDGLATAGIKFPITSSRLRSMTQDYPTPMEPTFRLLGEPEKSLDQAVEETVVWLRGTDGFRRIENHDRSAQSLGADSAQR